MADRNLVVRIIGDDRSLQQAFRRSGNAGKSFGNEMERAGRGALAASLSFRGLGRSLTFASAQFLGGAGVVFALKQVVSEASRVQEETEKTGIVFARSAPQVQAWAKTLANSFGIAEGAALEATGRFGNMLRPLGFAPAAAAKMSEALVQLSADMASFNNTKPDVVLEALSSGLAGQVRPLRQFGVFLSAARIQEEALADGLAKRGAKLTTAQKVQASYNIILKDTKLQQGDVARNTESLSVAQSKLTASIQDLEARLGKALLPSITAYVNKAAAWLSQSENQERVQRDLTEAVGAAVTVVKALAGAAGTLRDILRPVVDAMGGLRQALEGLAALSIANKLRNLGIGAIGTQAKASRAEVGLLKGSLLGLTRLGAILVPVEIAISLSDKQTRGKAGEDVKGGRLGSALLDIVGLSGVADFIDKKTGEEVHKVEASEARAIKKMKAAAEKRVPEFKKLIEKAGGVPDTSFAAQLRAAGFVGSTGPTTAETAATAKKRGLTAAQRNQFFDASIGRAQDLVQDQTSIQGQISALQKIAGLIQARLAKTKDITRRLTLEGQLRDVFRQIKADQTQIASDMKDALEARNKALAELTQANQFKALGLSGTGDQIIPGVKNLQKQLASLTARIGGTKLDTSKLRSQLAGIRKVLSGELGKATEQSRAKIADLFATIRQGFDKGTKDVAAGPLTKTTSLAGKVGQAFAGLGLSREQQKALSSRLTGFNSAGVGLGSRGAGLAGAGVTIVNNNTLTLDGHVVARNQNTINDKRKGRNSTPRRGRR